MPRPTGAITGRLVTASAIAGMLLFASVAFAAESKGGMPQLDFKNPLTISQVVWLAIIFTLLYLLLSRWALPKVGEVLAMRASTIAADLDAARSAKAAADAAVAELTEATTAAQATAQHAIAGAVATAKDAAAAQSASLNARLEAQLSDAEKRINVARSAAMAALRDVAADTATAVVTRLTGATPDTAAVDKAVGAALAARPA